MEDGSLQVNVGSLQTVIGSMRVSFVIQSSGVAFVQIYCSDPKDSRKAGVLFQLDGKHYQELKDLIGKTDEAIAKFEAAGQVRPGTMSRR
jgi:hypothetical protein